MSMIERVSGTRTATSSSQTMSETLRAAAAATARFIRNRLAIKQMVHLDDALLKDIGLTRGEVENAYMKPVTNDPMAELRRAASDRAARMSL
ncbi:DUF1127 domain-containing protein [Martelella endophytica]|uniref:YjiS-like domain-containing protein n=1 Tax=Martelella endophytica TaxID=1486262 RepID=A0A0D5LQV4_MAREN|nr:DUF1127 domain-containing protein [Martelella endophytica]AJY46142.1 hypothetical protein TM49_11385 [Martelella endophytica]